MSMSKSSNFSWTKQKKIMLSAFREFIFCYFIDFLYFRFWRLNFHSPTVFLTLDLYVFSLSWICILFLCLVGECMHSILKLLTLIWSFKQLCSQIFTKDEKIQLTGIDMKCGATSKDNLVNSHTVWSLITQTSLTQLCSKQHT